MDEQHTGMQRYNGKDGECYAAKITLAEPADVPGRPGCVRVVLGEVDKEMTIIPEWVDLHKPEVGGYFFVRAGVKGASFMAANDFESRNKRIGE